MHDPVELPLWTVLPFAGLLLSIAVLPLAAPHFWESHRNKGVVSALFGVPVAVYLVADILIALVDPRVEISSGPH